MRGRQPRATRRERDAGPDPVVPAGPQARNRWKAPHYPAARRETRRTSARPAREGPTPKIARSARANPARPVTTPKIVHLPELPCPAATKKRQPVKRHSPRRWAAPPWQAARTPKPPRAMRPQKNSAKGRERATPAPEARLTREKPQVERPQGRVRLRASGQRKPRHQESRQAERQVAARRQIPLRRAWHPVCPRSARRLAEKLTLRPEARPALARQDLGRRLGWATRFGWAERPEPWAAQATTPEAPPAQTTRPEARPGQATQPKVWPRQATQPKVWPRQATQPQAQPGQAVPPEALPRWARWSEARRGATPRGAHQARSSVARRGAPRQRRAMWRAQTPGKKGPGRQVPRASAGRTRGPKRRGEPKGSRGPKVAPGRKGR